MPNKIQPKTITYSDAIDWVALNDDPVEMRANRIKGTLTVGMVSDLFNVPRTRVVKDVQKVRSIEFMGRHIEDGRFVY